MWAKDRPVIAIPYLRPIRLWLLAVLSLMASGAVAEVSHDPVDVIERLYREGGLSFDEKALLQVTAIVSPGDLPEPYRKLWKGGDRFTSCSPTMALLDVFRNRDLLTPDTRDRVARLLDRPVRQRTYQSPAGLLLLHFDTSGAHRVPAADTNSNLTPDFVERCAAFLDTSWLWETGQGFIEPPSDTGLGGNDLYDVYFQEMSYYGYVATESDGPAGWDDAVSYMVLHHDFTDFPPNEDPEGDEIGSAKVTCAHEFRHAVQFAYATEEASWFMEMDAAAVEEFIFPIINDNFTYLSAFFQTPDLSLMTDGLRSYGSFVFGLYLAKAFDTSLMLAAWQGARYQPTVFGALGDTLSARYGAPLDSVVADFAVWNYVTGSRSDGLHYEDGALYPLVPLAAVHSSYPVDSTVSACEPEGYGACYLQFQAPGTTSGRYRFEFDGGDEADWIVWLVKSVSSNNHDIEQMTLDPVTHRGFVEVLSIELYYRYALVVVNTDTSSNGAAYLYWVRPATLRQVDVSSTITDGSVYSASWRDWPFRIDNASAMSDTYDVTIIDDSGWVTPDTLTVYVPADSFSTFTARVTPLGNTPTGAPLGVESIVRVTAGSRFDPWVADTVTTAVRTVIRYGDADFDGEITIGDLTVLIDHLFISYQPIMPVEAAANSDCVDPITMGDLTHMIDWLFISYAPPTPCNPY